VVRRGFLLDGILLRRQWAALAELTGHLETTLKRETGTVR